MINRNWKTDFKHRETFYAFSNNVLTSCPIPTSEIDFIIEYFTDQNKAVKFIASRIGGKYLNCKPNDANSIIVALALSRKFLGSGKLIREVTIKQPDDDFESGIRVRCLPGSTGILLWEKGSESDEIQESKITL